MSTTQPDKYLFFNDYKTYKLYEDHIEKDFLNGKHRNACSSSLPDAEDSNSEFAKDICAKFKHFYDFIILTKGESKPKSLDNKDFTYLNYWLNSKLRINTISSHINVNDIHNKLKNCDSEIAGKGKFEGNLYEIEDEDFENMNLLNKLHNSHSEIFNNISKHRTGKISCLKQYTEFIDTYKKGISQCHNDNINFCHALNIYKNKYKEIYGTNSISDKCSDADLLKLPTYKDIARENCTLFEKEDEKNFVFTPLGKWIRSKKVPNKEAHNNIYGKNDHSFLNTSDNESINMNDDPYHISYNSMGNL
ncbi:PIR Superfamily Protein [Plasmodium ovale curtisi]|uniref:PIR Superfamily Protein n=1 Tax=Plasmodium ovale curtisi TaxID=864141 RepID=A0A1A8X6H5_PLAOA|nr:PIR Superfamily Protein [Plasmodium ovale curtisi]